MGKSSSVFIPDFEPIKNSCINVFLLPLQSENWETPTANQFLLELHKKKLTHLQTFFANDDITHYLEIVSLLQMLIPLYEKWKKENPDKSNNIISMVYTTTMLKIKPEYEIYHQLLGKPDRILGDKYNSTKLLKIQSLMKEENINLEKIRQQLSL
jgi:hypothetical protein